jgi:hypothetical protein
MDTDRADAAQAGRSYVRDLYVRLHQVVRPLVHLALGVGQVVVVVVVVLVVVAGVAAPAAVALLQPVVVQRVQPSAGGGGALLAFPRRHRPRHAATATLTVLVLRAEVQLHLQPANVKLTVIMGFAS